MSDPAPTTPTLTPETQALLNRIGELELQSAKDRVFAQHPQIPRDLLDHFQGGPEDIAAFGTRLAERFPAPAPQPVPLTQASQPQPPAQVSGAPAPPTQPAVASVPESTQSPAPAPADLVDQHSAADARTEEVRERMRQGLATQAEVLWLSQNGTNGFVRAMNSLSGEMRARAGRA